MTNTIPLPAEKRLDKMTVLSVAPLLGEAIIRIHEDLSVSKLFRLVSLTFSSGAYLKGSTSCPD